MAIKSKQYAVDTWYMEYRAGTSDKFYQVFVSESGLTVLRWGRRGTAGQHSESRYASYDEARDHGLKQVFAKKSKGYSQQGPDTKFMATQEALDAAQRGNPNPLISEWAEAQRNGQYAGAKQTVLKHYADFSDRVQTLLHQAEYADAGTLTEEFAAIEEVWEEISDKHREVQAALDLTRQTLFQKMMAGS
jgi:predicted DNA-binding WGR domain protein